ncbi:hypothetical protein M8J77_007028 [Diaphorina citri]|nr:hypothetical protein M8J77_007028 [Diaphorina citri]
MRQKDDSSYAGILSRVRLGILTKDDQDILSQRLITIKSESISSRLKEVTDHLNSLPDDTVCLLPTKHMCEQFNKAMLNSIDHPEVEVLALDKIDCPRYLSKRAEEAVQKYEDDASMTAGLENKIVLKMGARIMLRRNIDTRLELDLPLNRLINRTLTDHFQDFGDYRKRILTLVGEDELCEHYGNLDDTIHRI